jgi:hypothetical protein
MLKITLAITKTSKAFQPGVELGHRQCLLLRFHDGIKERERSSFKLASAIALLNFGLSSLELLRCIMLNIKTKKQNMKMKEGKGAYLLACCNVGWGDLNLKMNKNMNYYTF